MPEVPWFTEPPEAELYWTEPNVLGHLHFIDPNGNKAVIPVTYGESRLMKTKDGLPGSPIWHIEINDKVATVSPSIHYIDFWHSPNPVKFKLTNLNELEE